MDEDERLNFNSFVDAYNAYQNPNLAPVAPAFGGYGYQAPTMDMMLAPQQMPQMMLDPSAIYDPSVAAAMQILNQPMMIRQAPGLLGAGTDYQNQFGLLQNIAPTRMQQYQRIAAPPPPPPPPVSGGDGGGGGNYGNYDSFGRDDGDLYTYNEQYDAQGGGSRAPDWVGLPADMAHRNFMGDIFGYQDPAPVYNMSTGTTHYANIGDPNAGMGGTFQGVTGSGSAGSTAATRDMPDGPDGANASSGGKIVCTAMNQAYGFGSFRNRIWLAYSAKHLTKAHEAGYHALFLPLVDVGYNQGNKMHNRIVRRVLENIARHRSADLRAEMSGGKRDRIGQAYRFILEPLCYAVGKLKGK
jgi:hypothetical protein